MIPIYEAGEHEGQLYLAMRFVEGSDLKTMLERDGKLAPERRWDLLAQVAGALDAAHRRALVHRDVKPANVLLDGGRARLPHRLRHHQAARRRPRPTPAAWSARSTTWRPSRSAATRWTGARTATRSAACSTSAWRGAAVPARHRGGDALGAHAGPEPASLRARGWIRCSARRSPRTARTATAAAPS